MRGARQPVRRPPEHADARASLERTLVSTVKAQMIWLFAYLTSQTIDVAHGRAEGLGVTVWLLLAVLPVIMVVYFFRRSQLS